MIAKETLKPASEARASSAAAAPAEAVCIAAAQRRRTLPVRIHSYI